MRYRMTFAAGLAVGYVLGSRAGRERYEQIKRTARRVADSPTVQEAAGLMGAQVAKVADLTKAEVGKRIPFLSKHNGHNAHHDTGTGWPGEVTPQETGAPY
ncbi:YtxH domain-containing protein [Nonomuraea sp. NBC_01738]|uniref:YtxH domain-containing protein n=1 Tax=Nonomuraea sp. NBC_01738 TaxID=2976003 RepID=UPI002E10E394|nr:YtxH domain-containing protein [Nonomuraea sp. NBC_01738]